MLVVLGNVYSGTFLQRFLYSGYNYYIYNNLLIENEMLDCGICCVWNRWSYWKLWLMEYNVQLEIPSNIIQEKVGIKR